MGTGLGWFEKRSDELGLGTVIPGTPTSSCSLAAKYWLWLGWNTDWIKGVIRAPEGGDGSVNRRLCWDACSCCHIWWYMGSWGEKPEYVQVGYDTGYMDTLLDEFMSLRTGADFRFTRFDSVCVDSLFTSLWCKFARTRAIVTCSCSSLLSGSKDGGEDDDDEEGERLGTASKTKIM